MDKETENLNSIEKKNTYLEYALFLILGFLLGIVIKTEAAKRITIGYNDYQVDVARPVYDINQLQKEINSQAQEQAGAGQENNAGQQDAEGEDAAQ